MESKSPSVFVLVLNWNGWRDTIECLESLFRSTYRNFRIVLIDNGSTDDSIEQIHAWSRGDTLVVSRYIPAVGQDRATFIVEYSRTVAEAGGCLETEQSLTEGLPQEKLVLIQNEENLGFSGGNNVGIRYALANHADYIWLLNNDTCVEPDALTKLVEFLHEHAAYQGVTGQIRYYDTPHIWNCGGRLTWYGSRKYYYAGVSTANTPQSGWQPITFVTGCAALFRSSVFSNLGLLSERFFFGEEDYELSKRLLSHKYRLACDYEAVIYHKVSATVKQSASRQCNMWYIYYLNRFIHMRDYFPQPIWQIWRQLSLLYILLLLKIKYQASWLYLLKLRRRLLDESDKLSGVSKATFERILAKGIEP